MGSSSSADKAKAVEEIEDPKKERAPEFNKIITGYTEGESWSMSLFITIRDYIRDYKGHHEKYPLFIMDLVALKDIYKDLRRSPGELIQKEYLRKLNEMYDNYISLRTGTKILDLSHGTRTELGNKKTNGWVNKDGKMMTPIFIWHDAEKEVIRNHLEPLYKEEFIHSDEYMDWLKSDDGKAYKKWLKSDDGKVYERWLKSEKVSIPKGTDPISKLYQGMSEHAGWAQALWKAVHAFCGGAYCEDSTLFIKAVANLKRAYDNGELEGHAYTHRLNEIYKVCIEASYADEEGVMREINIGYLKKKRLKTLYQEHWREDAHLLSPEQIWDEAVREIIKVIRDATISGSFKKTESYREWEMKYGRNYMEWLRDRAKEESTATASKSAGSASKSAASSRAHINYFNEMMDYEGSSQYLPYNKFVDHGQYDKNYLDINVELMAFFAIIIICFMVIYGFCIIIICILNFCIAHWYNDIKQRYKEEQEVISI